MHFMDPTIPLPKMSLHSTNTTAKKVREIAIFQGWIFSMKKLQPNNSHRIQVLFKKTKYKLSSLGFVNIGTCVQQSVNIHG